MPWFLIHLGVANKGASDCGAHEWYKETDAEDHCYHCEVGVRRPSRLGKEAPVIEGDGFELRALALADAEAWKQGEDPEQIRWFEAPGPAPIENIVAAIEAWRSGWDDNGAVRHWGIWVDGGLVGGVELRIRKDEKANISYLVFPHARGRGLAAKAVQVAARWAFSNLGVPAVVAVIDERNTASRSTATRAGFSFDGPAEPWEYSEHGVMLRYVMESER